MKFEIRNRWNGMVQFTAQIKAGADAPLSVRIGLAVKWAVANDAELSGADLSGANLSGANLSGAYLSGADLSGADLSGANLSSANLSGAYLSGAYLSGANLTDANLTDANLSGAYLSGANLSGANLTDAYLTDANLSGAYLSGADLSGARGINPYLCTPLLMLLDQPGRIRAYKIVNEKNEGIFTGGLKYKVGKWVSVKNANCDPQQRCGAGINVATLDWCIREWCVGHRILLVEFDASDIACIPTATDGKFRLHRCNIISEVDLVKIGLVKPETEKEAA